MTPELKTAIENVIRCSDERYKLSALAGLAYWDPDMKDNLIELEIACRAAAMTVVGAETILEEMYDDSQVKPFVVGSAKKSVQK